MEVGLTPNPEEYAITIKGYILSIFDSPEVVLGVDDLREAVMAEFMTDAQTVTEEIDALIALDVLSYDPSTGDIRKN